MGEQMSIIAKECVIKNLLLRNVENKVVIINMLTNKSSFGIK